MGGAEGQFGKNTLMNVTREIVCVYPLRKSKGIDFVGIRCLLSLALSLSFFIPRGEIFWSCLPDRGQRRRGERPCDSARDCQVIFFKAPLIWKSCAQPTDRPTEKTKVECVCAMRRCCWCSRGEVPIKYSLVQKD